MKISSEKRYDVADWILLLAGAACGLGLAWVLDGFQLHFPGELAKAREWGIVSLTTLSGYPKSRDLFTYFFALVLPVIGAITAWLLYRKPSSFGTNTLADGFEPPTFATRVIIFLIPLVTGFFAWNITTMLTPKWNQYVGAWIFSGEQGATMAWTQSIINGGVYGRDFFSLYGPMFVYPLTWMMDLLGRNVFMEQIYKWLLDTIAFAMLGFILLRTIRIRWLALVFILVIFLIFSPQNIVTANNSIIRSILGLFPIVCIALWMDTKRNGWFIAGGLILGQSLLYSQEAGFCALAAIVVMLAFYSPVGKENLLAKLRVTAAFPAVLLISLTPMLGYLSLKGALPGFLDSIIGYPKTVMMGYGAMPFSSIRGWLDGNFRELWLDFAVIGVYSASAIAIFVAWQRKVRSSRIFWATGLLVYGVLLFRVALGRSSTGQTMKIMIPAILLSALWIDELLINLRKNNVLKRRQQFVSLVMLAAVLINFLAGICLDPVVRVFIGNSCRNTVSLKGKFEATRIKGVEIKEIPRSGQFVDKNTAADLRAINNFLNANTKDGDYVYFFPNEAVYYFLFNRANPTRYALAYFASSYDRQREIISDLEKNKPRYIVYSKKTWRLDSIPENIQIPLIVNYINQNYKKVVSLNDVDILTPVAIN